MLNRGIVECDKITGYRRGVKSMGVWRSETSYADRPGWGSILQRRAEL